jgi:hypothetical protein
VQSIISSARAISIMILFGRIFRGLNHFFTIVFPKKVFPRILWKSLPRKNFSIRSGSPNEHVRSVTIYPMLSERYFHTDVRRHDREAGYNDDNMQKFKWARYPTRASAGPVRCSPASAQGRLRWRLETQRCTQMTSAHRGESITDDAHSVEDHHSSTSANQNASDNVLQWSQCNAVRVCTRKKCTLFN